MKSWKAVGLLLQLAVQVPAVAHLAAASEYGRWHRRIPGRPGRGGCRKSSPAWPCRRRRSRKAAAAPSRRWPYRLPVQQGDRNPHAVGGLGENPPCDIGFRVVAAGDLLLLQEGALAARHVVVVDPQGRGHGAVGKAQGGGLEKKAGIEGEAVGLLLEGDGCALRRRPGAAPPGAAGPESARHAPGSP